MVNIYGVTAESAVRWLAGHGGDEILDRSRCEVAYLNELVGGQDYPEFLRQSVALYHAGAGAVIAHVTNQEMERRYLRYGCVITFREQIVWRGVTVPACRLAVLPDQWVKYIQRMERLLAATNRKQALPRPSGSHQNAP